MNKNTLVTALAVIILFILLFSLFNTEEIDQKSLQNNTSKNKIVEKSPRQEVSVSYSQADTDKKPVAMTKKKPKKQKIEKDIESITYDGSKTFQLAIINPEKTSETLSRDTRMIKGSIDGNIFLLPIPKKLIYENPTGIKLRIKNIKTGTMQTIDAAFINDMQDPTIQQELNIDSHSPENYEQKTRNLILPPRPGM